jgi:hypothetical protein
MSSYDDDVLVPPGSPRYVKRGPTRAYIQAVPEVPPPPQAPQPPSPSTPTPTPQVATPHPQQPLPVPSGQSSPPSDSDGSSAKPHAVQPKPTVVIYDPLAFPAPPPPPFNIPAIVETIRHHGDEISQNLHDFLEKVAEQYRDAKDLSEAGDTTQKFTDPNRALKEHQEETHLRWRRFGPRPTPPAGSEGGTEGGGGSSAENLVPGSGARELDE